MEQTTMVTTTGATTVTTYLIYLAVSIALTVWVARTLFKNGRVFLVDVFKGNEDLADSVNRLLVVRFYLVNLGYVSLALKLDQTLENARQSVEALSWKVGLVLVVLGVMHFFNLYVFSRMRRGGRKPRPLPFGPPPGSSPLGTPPSEAPRPDPEFPPTIL